VPGSDFLEAVEGRRHARGIVTVVIIIISVVGVIPLEVQEIGSRTGIVTSRENNLFDSGFCCHGDSALNKMS
jgi:hypothetical protein